MAIAKGKAYTTVSTAEAVEYQWSNGKTVRITYAELKKFPQLWDDHAKQGIRVRLERATALEKNEDGSSASVEDKFKRMDALAQALRKGEYSAKYSVPRVDPILVKAVAEVFKKSEEAVFNLLVQKSDAERLAIQVLKAVKKVYDRLLTESVANVGVDLESELAALGEDLK